MICVDKSHLIMTWLEANETLQLEWHGFVQSPDFRAGMLQGLEQLQTKHGHKWLADMSQMRVIAVSDQDWVVNNWAGLSAKAGLRYIAIVQSKNVLAQMSTQRVEVEIQKNLSHRTILTQYFDDKSKALEWLQSQN